MGDHFVLLVDRLLTESTLEAAIGSRNQLTEAVPLTGDGYSTDCTFKDSGADLSSRKMVECRICQDEDWDSNMETPCSCCGSLKYAHRRCVQRWCNEKGDTVCEICNQDFKPGYTAPPSIFRLRGIPMNFRGNWEIARRDLNNPPSLIAMVSTDQNILDPNYDEHSLSNSRFMVCCRSIAIIFMVLLILQHTLPIVVTRAGNYSSPPIMLLLLRIIGIILPIYIIMKSVIGVLRRRRNQVNPSLSSSDEEAGSTALQLEDDVSHV